MTRRLIIPRRSVGFRFEDSNFDGSFRGRKWITLDVRLLCILQNTRNNIMCNLLFTICYVQLLSWRKYSNNCLKYTIIILFRNLCFKDASFDHYYCKNFLEYVKDVKISIFNNLYSLIFNVINIAFKATNVIAVVLNKRKSLQIEIINEEKNFFQQLFKIVSKILASLTTLWTKAVPQNLEEFHFQNYDRFSYVETNFSTSIKTFKFAERYRKFQARNFSPRIRENTFEYNLLWFISKSEILHTFFSKMFFRQ